MAGFSKRLSLTTVLAASLFAAGSASAGTVTWWATEPAKAQAEKLAADFEKANPDIKINLQYNPYGGLQGKVLIALKSGIPPDIIEIQTYWIPPYVATGTLEDVGDVIFKRLHKEDFVPAALAAATVGGKTYGLPFQAEALAMLYRKDLFREAGLDPDKPPQTWADMIAASKKLTYKAANGQQRYGYGIVGGGPEGVGNALYRSMPYMWMNGGGILSKDEKQVIIDTPETVAAVKFYTDMYTTLKVSPPSTLENDGLALRRLFEAGTIAMYQGTPTELDRFKVEAPTMEYGVAMVPHPEGKPSASVLGSWAFIVPKAGKNKADALKFLSWLADRQVVGFYTRTFPAVKTAFDLPRFANPQLDAFKAMMNTMQPQPSTDAWPKISDIYFRHLQEILIGGATPQQAMDAAAKEIKAIVNK